MIVQAKGAPAGSPATYASASDGTLRIDAHHRKVGALSIHPRGKVGQLVVHDLQRVLVVTAGNVLVAAVIREHE